MFREIVITDQMKVNARVKSDEMGSIRGSIRNGSGNMIGFLGEELVKKHLGIGDGNTFEFDLKYNGIKLEVKTKERNVEPKSEYNATVFSWNARQKCDYYVFCSIYKDFSRGWICGCIKPDEFKKSSVFSKKGDPDGDFFKFFSDCYNLPYEKLHDINSIKSYLDDFL